MNPIVIGVQSTGPGFRVKWAEFLSRHGAQVRWLDLRRNDWLDQVRGCRGIMWHWRHHPDDRQSALPILLVLERELGLPVFPNLDTAWHYDNKIAQLHLHRVHDIPGPKAWLFWDHTEALKWCDQAPYPVVAKLACGAGSSNVRLIRSRRQGRAWIRSMFSRGGRFAESQLISLGTPHGLAVWARRAVLRALYAPAYILVNRPALPSEQWAPQHHYALFQEFLAGNRFDTRITVIGDRAFGFRRMNRPGDFRASGSGLIDWNPTQIDPRCVALAFSAAQKLRSQSMAFDFLVDPSTQNPVIVEFSYAFVDTAVERCPGHWNREGQWREGHLWPEEAHVIDFLRTVAHPRGNPAAISEGSIP